MEKKMSEPITYKELLGNIKGKKNHLLLGNGFNNSLSIGTSYKDIYTQMKINYCGYGEIEELISEKGYDIEIIIEILQKNIKDDSSFLKKYINNKVKLDFMKAANTIVQNRIKGIYNNKNKGLFILFNNFTNYFTLNYDPFLYLLLMKFKKPNNRNIKEKNTKNELFFSFTDTINSKKSKLTKDEEKLHELIKEARKKGNRKIDIGSKIHTFDLKKDKKTVLKQNIKDFLKAENKQYNENVLDKVIDHILEEEKNNENIKFEDGFRPLEDEISAREQKCIYQKLENQNIFFLHGAFHIVHRKEQPIYKITQTSEKALYTRIEEVINNEEEIICVFQPNDKYEEVNNNEYLQTGYQKLSDLQGFLVIIGCSMSENDSYIFEQIERSDIETIYITIYITEEKEDKRKKEIKEFYDKAKKYFKDKEIILVDAKTINYDK